MRRWTSPPSAASRGCRRTMTSLNSSVKWPIVHVIIIAVSSHLKNFLFLILVESYFDFKLTVSKATSYIAQLSPVVQRTRARQEVRLMEMDQLMEEPKGVNEWFPSAVSTFVAVCGLNEFGCSAGMAINEDVRSDAPNVIREPLIRVENNLTDEDGSSAHGSSRGNPWMVYLSTFVAVCGSYEFGCCAGYSSPTQSAIREDLSLTLAEFSVFGSILTFGAMIGAITIGPITDFLGRKGALRLSSAFCIAGWLAIYFSKGALSLDIGRLANGYGMGAFSYVVPIFIAEIAPKNLRGRLTAINQVMVCSGVSISFLIGILVSWRALALIGLVPCAVIIFGLFFIPESPRWLAKIGREKEFEVALQKLRGKDADISDEAAEIKDYIATLDHLPKAKFLDLFQRRYLRSVIIGVGLMVCQQVGGINGVCFYVSDIFVQAGFSSTVGTASYAVIQVVVTAITASAMDKAGRKPLILASAAGLVLGCLLTAISFFLKAHDLALKASPLLAGVGIMMYIGSFSVGMGAVPWVVMSEIFPINIKGQGGSLATLVNWFGAWLCSYTFNFLMNWSSYGTFLLYAAINALAILFVILMVPETKGKTLEQIQAAINK